MVLVKCKMRIIQTTRDYTKRIHNALKGITLPDRTRIFLSSIWVWVYVMFYMTKIINKVLGFILVYTPDSLIIHNPYRLKESNDQIRPKIISAKIITENNEIITNKIQTIVDRIWDHEIDDLNKNSSNKNNSDNTDYDTHKGGINVKDIVSIYPTLSSAIIWIAYLFETEKKINKLSDEELGKKIKHLIINFGDRIIYRNEIDKPETIIAGEVQF